MEITCPSGLRGVIRGMKGREAQAFVDPALARTHGSMDALLANCWLETLDPGPYELAAPAKARPGKEAGPPVLSWRDVLIGDRFHALMEIRALTFGQDYHFSVKCESCTDKHYGWELQLADLARKKLPPESFQKIQAGQNRFEIAMPDGKVLAFKLGTGVEEAKIAAMKGGMGGGRKLGPVDTIAVQAIGVYVRVHEAGAGEVNALATELVSESGETLKPIPGGPIGVRRYLEEVDYPDLLETLEAMQAPDCGVETKIETICEHCGFQQWIELPFQRTFFERRKKAG